MYKIFINDTLVCLLEDMPVDNKASDFINNPKQLLLAYRSEEDLVETIKTIENNKKLEKVYIVSFDLEHLKSIFFKQFEIIKAAGGLVLNELGELLMIFRRGKWDLPKGKIDEGEDVETTALREVKEETGIKKLNLGAQIDTVYHVYYENDRHILKMTNWYKMTGKSNEKLIPETKEDITKAVWLDKVEVQKNLKNTYRSIADLIELNYL